MVVFDISTLGHSCSGTGKINTVLKRRVLTADTWSPRVDHTWWETMHLEKVHCIHHDVQPDSFRKPPPSPTVHATVSTSVAPNVPSASSPVPSPDHGSRTQLIPLRSQSQDNSLEPVEITTKKHELLTYVVEASWVFDTKRKIVKKDFPPVSEVGSPSHSPLKLL